jgi:hypothetical protein
VEKKRETMSGGEGGAPMSYPRLLSLVKFNLRAMVRLGNLVLILLSALTTYYAVHISSYAGGGLLNSFVNLFTVTGLPIMAYLVACNLVNEDSGSLPSPLLFSRPVARRAFLATGFTVRLAFFTTFGYAVPFLIGYAEKISEPGGLAWGELFLQYFASLAAYVFATAALTALVAVVVRRGLIAIPFMVALTFFFHFYAGPAVTWYAGGRAAAPSPFAFLMVPFLLLASLPSLPGYGYMVNPPVMSLPQATLALFVYGSFLLLLTVAIYPKVAERG